jgi:hypothetical protein
LTVPLNVAVVPLTPVALPVTAVGAVEHCDVVNVTSAPLTVAALFVATARKWYSVPHVSPDKLPLLIGTTAVPAETLTLWVVCP